MSSAKRAPGLEIRSGSEPPRKSLGSEQSLSFARRIQTDAMFAAAGLIFLLER